MNFPITNVVPSPDDLRDLEFRPIPAMFSDVVSLRPWNGLVRNQRRQGSCVAQTIANIGELFLTRAGRPEVLSPQWIYDLARIMEDRRGKPGLSNLRDALKVGQKWGIPLESEYPAREDDSQPVADPLSLTDVAASAATRKFDRYERIDVSLMADGTEPYVPLIRSALAQGCPLALAMRLGKKFRDVAGPLDDQRYLVCGVPGNEWIGNHAMMMCEWRASACYGVDENTWDRWWGDEGLFAHSQVVLIDVTEMWAVRGFAGIYMQPTYPRAVIKEYCDLCIAAHPDDIEAGARAIWEGMREHGITSDQVEAANEWPAGSIERYTREKGWA